MLSHKINKKIYLYMELEVVYYEVNLDDKVTGLKRTSLVDDPAIGVLFDKFEDVVVDKFEVTDEDKRIVSGPVMIPQLKMLRKYSGTNKYYYAIFTEEAILNTVKKASKEKKFNEVNLQHLQTEEAMVTCAFMIESYILSDEVRPEKYKDLPNGTWIASFWIEDVNYWNNIIKSDEFRGFSVEIAVEQVPEADMKFSDDIKELVREITFSSLNDDIKERLIWSLLYK